MKRRLPLFIPAALRGIVFGSPADPTMHGTLVDGINGHLYAASDLGMVVLPLPANAPRERRMIPPGDGDLTVDLASLDHHPLSPGWGDPIPRDTSPAFRICIDVKTLVAFATALDAETVTIEGPADFTESTLMEVQAWPPNKTGGYALIMPSGPLEGQGLLGNTSKIEGPGDASPTPIPGPPVITASVERKTIEVLFDGKPEKSVLDALKGLDIGMRYTKNGFKGMTPRTWYAPDNPYARQQLAALFPDSPMPEAACQVA